VRFPSFDVAFSVTSERQFEVGLEGSQDCMTIQLLVKSPKFLRKGTALPA
jgi:hypothetical protein